MVVRVGRSGIAFRMNLVGEGLEKQEAIKLFSWLELKDRSMGMRLVLGESLWKDFQKSWGSVPWKRDCSGSESRQISGLVWCGF